jgi:L-fuculose-phosphate aldolase
VQVTLKGDISSGRLRPSTETPLHSRIYLTRDDVHAIIHAHSPVTLGTALAGVEVKPMTPESVLFVGEVPIVEFAAPRTEDLADRVVEAVKSHQVAVMQNHGGVATRGNMVEALNRLGGVELRTRIMTIANIWGGSPALSPNQLDKLKRPATSS